MGHRHHRKHRGCGGCGSCGVCIPGGGWGPGYGPGLRFGQEAVVPAMDVMAANGQVLATAPLAGPYGAMAPYAAMPLAAPGVSYNQARMAQYAALRSAAGLPVGVIAAPLGFRAKKVRRKKTRTIKAHLDTFFTGDGGIYIPHRVAKHFDICSLRVGQIYLFGGRDPVPAEIFSDRGACGEGPLVIPLPGVGPGQCIYLTVKNRDCKHSHWFRAAIRGKSLI